VFVGWYHEIEDTYGPFQAQVADHANATMVLDTLAEEHSIFLETAEKREKNDHIALFNLDLDRKLIRTLPESPLTVELLGNKWDERKLANGKREEDRNTPNDTCDAALYAFRWAAHRRSRDAEKNPPPGSANWWAAQMSAELEAAKRVARERANPEQYARLDSEEWMR
jgi:hypothetical protein